MSTPNDSTSSLEDFQKLLLRSQDRSLQRQKLNESVRQAYVSIAEAKMLFFAQQQHGYLEFCDAVKFGQNLLASSDDEEEEEEENPKKFSSAHVSRSATFKLQVGDETSNNSLSVLREEIGEEKIILSAEDDRKAKSVLSEKSLKSIQSAFREILHRAVELSQV